MHVKKFLDILAIDFFTGVPDSRLKPLCNYLIDEYGISDKHIICANEGNCTALAAGYYMAMGKTPLVYMQNSGIGNAINPIASLLNDKVYGIPCVFVVGWRGQPGLHDEPQHIFQGEVTLTLLEDMDIKTFVMDENVRDDELENIWKEFKVLLEKGKSVAFVVKEGALSYDNKIKYSNNNTMKREDIIKRIVEISGNDIVVSTTGKASRELFEIREMNKQEHKYDFLTVGSMGHASTIAMGIALNKPNSRVWCIDGDGAALMHMGAMPVIGVQEIDNLIHVVLNNGSHETVGGMPTVMSKINLSEVAKGCGYAAVYHVKDFNELDKTLRKVKNEKKLTFIEVDTAIGSRADLGRPTTTAKENKENFMEYLKEKC